MEIRRLVTFAIALLLVSAPFAWLAYRQYVEANTVTFGYRLTLAPNGTAPDSVIVPVPGEETLLTNLHATSGAPVWSLVDTPHGRGLRVNFSAAVTLDATFSEWAPPGTSFNHNTTPTMLANVTSYAADVWVYHEGASSISVGLWVDPWVLGGSANGSVSASQGWRTYPMEILHPP